MRLDIRKGDAGSITVGWRGNAVEEFTVTNSVIYPAGYIKSQQMRFLVSYKHYSADTVEYCK